MNATFTETKKGTWAYIQKKVRVDGRSTTLTIKKLGLLEDIRKEQGCSDPRQWVIDLARKMTQEEKEGKAVIELPFYPGKAVDKDARPLRIGGDLLLLGLYHRLGLPPLIKEIMKTTRARYDLDQILQTLVMGRILFPCSKKRTLEKSGDMIYPPSFKEEEMFRSLSLLSEHIDPIQACVFKNSEKILQRRTRVIYYDCTNYFFETEDNDRDFIDEDTGEFVPGLRRYGKSKEHRPNPIVQMGLFMDMDGIPLAFVIFPGNESEQNTLRPLEEKLNRDFGMTDYVVSTDAGLGSEENRRYNMAEGRDYICVQSLPKLKGPDQDEAIKKTGWKIAWCESLERACELEKEWSEDGIFDLERLLAAWKEDVDRTADKDLKSRMEEQRVSKVNKMLENVTFYKEILVTKEYKYEDAEYKRQKQKDPDKEPVDKQGNKIPKTHTLKRDERLIVTYSHDHACYLRHKREERLKISEVIVKSKKKKSRVSQQSPLKYVKTKYTTKDGREATKVEMSIDDRALEQEERFDGFYAYATSLEDDGVDVLKIRNLHHEIEHLFRTTKTHLEARPVYLSRQDRIRSHFLVCFLAMLILKILQKKISDTFKDFYMQQPLSIDSLIETLRDFKFGCLPKGNYQPMYRRTPLTEQILKLLGLEADRQIITCAKMRAMYRKIKV